jgi:importin-5
MPLLLSVLQNAQGSEYHKLRLKAMECAGLVGEFGLSPSASPSFNVQSAIAVGRDTFREDSRKLCELLMQVQSELRVFSLKEPRGDHKENR